MAAQIILQGYLDAQGARISGLVALVVLIVLFALPFVLAFHPAGLGSAPCKFYCEKGNKDGDNRSVPQRDRLSSAPSIFSFFSALVVYKGRVVAGEYELSKDMSILQIARKMADGERKIYILKIVEGYNLYTIGDVVERAGIMDAAAFLELAREPDFLKRLRHPVRFARRIPGARHVFLQQGRSTSTNSWSGSCRGPSNFSRKRM